MDLKKIFRGVLFDLRDKQEFTSQRKGKFCRKCLDKEIGYDEDKKSMKKYDF